MDYEKKYKETLERARAKYAMKDQPIHQDLVDIFPELKESEGEKVRKALIQSIRDTNEEYFFDEYGVHKEDAIAWLEKQGEQKPMTIQIGKSYKCIGSPRYTCFKRGDVYKPCDEFICSLMNLCSDCFEPIEDGEQKPAELANGEDYGIDGLWTALDILQKTYGKVEGYQTDDGILEHECAISAVKKLYEQKPAWSEEDEDNFKHLMDEIVCLGNNRNSANRLYYDRLIKFIKELKNSVQPKEKWCEKDERMLDRLIAYFEKRVAFTDDDNPKYASWLKSLRHQKQWRPSEEQMKALHDLNLTGNLSYAGQGQVLIDLYNALKNLI